MKFTQGHYSLSIGARQVELTCCVLRALLPKVSPRVACLFWLPLPETEAVWGREPALPCPAAAGLEEEDGAGKSMSSSSSIAATPLGGGRDPSEGSFGRILAAELVVA